MRFRAIIRTDDAGMAANVGGAVNTEYRTVDFECPALSDALTLKPSLTYTQTQIVGIEVLREAVNACP